MADLFFYGTLCHVPLLETVLGRPRDQIDLAGAALPDHCAVWAAGEAFAILQPEKGATTTGLLARGLSTEDVERLRYYEGSTVFDLRALPVRTGETSVMAQVFFPSPGRWDAGKKWDYQDWVARFGAINTRAATEIMTWYGRMPADDILVRFESIYRRAAAWVSARERSAQSGLNVNDVVVHDHRRPYLNFFAVEEMDLQYRRFDGSLSNVVNRGALIVGQASVVLPYDPARDAVLLVEQFRAPLFMSGDRAPWVWEPVAGLVDAGETPEQTARRETMEEAGLVLDQLEKAGRVYSSTGSSSEFLNLFVGICDLGQVPDEGGGLDSEGEDIRSRIISFDDLMTDVDADRFRDMPLVTTALWLARHRDRLRTRLADQ